MIIMQSAYYGQRLEDQVVAMYAQDLADLPVDQISRALTEIRRDPRINRFPLPAVIRDRIMPAETTENDAREAAGRILTAVSRFGWCNPDRAKEFIGSLGWFVVERQGGWQNVCQVLDSDNVTTLQAQWRELAKVGIQRGKQGLLDTAPALPGASSGLANIGHLLKQMPSLPGGEE